MVLCHAILTEVDANAIAARETEAGGLVINGDCGCDSIAQLCLIGGLRTAPLSVSDDWAEHLAHLKLSKASQTRVHALGNVEADSFPKWLHAPAEAGQHVT